MTAAPATSRQIGAIHALKARIGLDDGSYRDVLQAETGQRSAKGLTALEAGRVLDRLKVWSNPAGPTARKSAPAEGAERLEGDYAGICRVLWISGYNLGVVQDRTDRGLIAFVRRQTGIAHLNWMHDGADARAVIEALKSWIAREAGGVEWDAERNALRAHNITLARWRKIAVVHAQLRRLAELGDHDHPTRTEIWHTDDASLDQMSSALGRRLRTRLNRKA